ncbi:MAG: hypothetical protein WCK90_01460 [archaeon]
MAETLYQALMNRENAVKEKALSESQPKLAELRDRLIIEKLTHNEVEKVCEEYRAEMDKPVSIPFAPLLKEIAASQAKVLSAYTHQNGILMSAMVGKRTVSESLEELAQPFRGFRKYLPHAVDKRHNDRIKQMGELVNEPRNLLTRGVFQPDNHTAIGVALMAPVLTTIASKRLLPYFLGTEEPENLPYVVIGACALAVGYACNRLVDGLNSGRKIHPAARLQAKYIDAAIERKKVMIDGVAPEVVEMGGPTEERGEVEF